MTSNDYQWPMSCDTYEFNNGSFLVWTAYSHDSRGQVIAYTCGTPKGAQDGIKTLREGSLVNHGLRQAMSISEGQKNNEAKKYIQSLAERHSQAAEAYSRAFKALDALEN